MFLIVNSHGCLYRAQVPLTSKDEVRATPDAVYIMYEYGVSFRIVWLNSKPDDPDPQWRGHSTGWCENGDTLVVDTVGFNDKIWLDEAAIPIQKRCV